MTPPRDKAARKADTLALLAAKEGDCWVASAGVDGPYLVPLSYAWVGDRVVIAGEASSRTVRNVLTSGTARLGFGPTRDVVMIDAEVAEEPAGVAEAYASQADWDPREAGDGYVHVALRPTRIQAWREADELPGRLLMRDGEWLV